MIPISLQEDTVEDLKAQYQSIVRPATEVRERISDQLTLLLQDNNLSLGVPIESRVKEWQKIPEKLQRENLQVKDLRKLDDLVGFRVILLFSREIKQVCDLIEENFRIIKRNNTRERLNNDQFGYSSIHFVAEAGSSRNGGLDADGLMAGFRIEIQVRTVAEHIWAATSHRLQYKNEQNIPESVRRSMSRVSAILETVDSEIESVLIERDEYRKRINPITSEGGLNVDLLETILEDRLPTENKGNNEPYDSLLRDLPFYGIHSAHDLRCLIHTFSSLALSEEARCVTELLTDPVHNTVIGDPKNLRLARGVFLTHCGLVRVMLKLKNPEVSRALLEQQRRENLVRQKT